MLAVFRQDRLWGAGRHEYLHGVVRVADCPMVQARLYPFVSRLFAGRCGLAKCIVLSAPAVIGGDMYPKRVRYLDVSRPLRRKGKRYLA